MICKNSFKKSILILLSLVFCGFILVRMELYAKASSQNEPPIITEDMVGEGILDEHIGYYAISTKEELLWFRDAVLSGRTNICALLLSDITVNTDLLEKKVSVDEATGEPCVRDGFNVDQWTPIPNFSGTIDGGGHRLSGILIKNNGDNTGLVATLSGGGAIKNLSIVDSYIYSTGDITGAVAGESLGLVSGVTVDSLVVGRGDKTGGLVGINRCEIYKSSFVSSMQGENLVGGIAGENIGEIRCSYSGSSNYESIVFGDRLVGGIVGKNFGSVAYCYSISEIVGEGSGISGGAEFGSEFVGCYYLGDSEEDSFDGTECKSKSSFGSGEVCCLLNRECEVFYQTVGKGTPAFFGESVYEIAIKNCPLSDVKEILYSNIAGEELIINPNHLYSFECDAFCDFCGLERNADKMHTFVDKCDEFCDVCQEYRKVDHDYFDECDADCNFCGAIREVNHLYDNDCDSECNKCQEKRAVTPHCYDSCLDLDCEICGYEREDFGHIYGDICDADCDNCGAIREVDHEYKYDCSAECFLCGAERKPGEHVYLFPCDTVCLNCGATRSVTHYYDNACDALCNLCGESREVADHKYSDSCDAYCNECGEQRLTNHSFDNACDAYCNLCGFVREVSEHQYTSVCDYICNECGYKRKVSGHEYDNPCDASCNLCDEVRQTAGHKYDNECDEDCNRCGALRDAFEHIFGAYYTTVLPTEDRDGEESRVCSICGLKESRAIPKTASKNEGLSVLIISFIGISVVLLIIVIVAIKIYGKRRLVRYD